MLTNLVRELDDHDLSVLHTRNTQNGLVGVACVNPLHKKMSHAGRAWHIFEPILIAMAERLTYRRFLQLDVPVSIHNVAENFHA